MAIGPQYTKCVTPAAYKDFDATALIVSGIIFLAAILGGTLNPLTILAAPFAWATFLVNFRALLEYMLYGKLICLCDFNSLKPDESFYCSDGKMVCFAGKVAHIEEVGHDKSPFETLDNDYCFNLVPEPFVIQKIISRIDAFTDELIKQGPEKYLEFISKFKEEISPGSFVTYNSNTYLITEDLMEAVLIRMGYGLDFEKNKDHVFAAPDSYYMSQQAYMPGDKFGGYSKLLVYFPNTNQWKQVNSVQEGYYTLVANWELNPYCIKIPVMHTECEGSRIHDVLIALNGLTLGSKNCKKNWWSKFKCFLGALASFFWSPAVLAGLMTAWFGADSGEQGAEEAGGGEVGIQDLVVVHGRWVYDAAHSGYNELHAVRRVMKVPEEQVNADPRGYTDRLGQELNRTPSVGLNEEIAASGMPLTAAQVATLEQQRLPENRWQLHPLLDGCSIVTNVIGGPE